MPIAMLVRDRGRSLSQVGSHVTRCSRSPILVSIVKQNEVTQLNEDNARFVAEAGAATKQLREQQAIGERQQTALHQALADEGRRSKVEQGDISRVLKRAAAYRSRTNSRVREREQHGRNWSFPARSASVRYTSR